MSNAEGVFSDPNGLQAQAVQCAVMWAQHNAKTEEEYNALYAQYYVEFLEQYGDKMPSGKRPRSVTAKRKRRPIERVKIGRNEKKETLEDDVRDTKEESSDPKASDGPLEPPPFDVPGKETLEEVKRRRARLEAERLKWEDARKIEAERICMESERLEQERKLLEEAKERLRLKHLDEEAPVIRDEWQVVEDSAYAKVAVETGNGDSPPEYARTDSKDDEFPEKAEEVHRRRDVANREAGVTLHRSDRRESRPWAGRFGTVSEQTSEVEHTLTIRKRRRISSFI